MLNELSGLQSSGERVWHTNFSVEVETRSKENGECVNKEYKFRYAKEWDKWAFQEYTEKRTDDTSKISDRNWRRSRHIVWTDLNEARTIDVPPEVAEKLAEAIGAESITIQVPVGAYDMVEETKEI